MRKTTWIETLFSNFLYKAMAVAIATALWYVVQGEEILEINRKLDVSFDIPTGFVAREGTGVSRDVTLRGPRVALADFSNRPIQAVIRVPVGKRGNLRYRLDKEFIPRWDNRIRITVHDPYVNLYVDERASKPVPVRVATVGTPKVGVTFKEIKTEPSEVTVTGLKSDVQKFQDVTTELVDLSGLGESKSIPVPLAISTLSNVEVSTLQVVVHVSVDEQKTSRTFDAIPMEVVGSEKLTHARPSLVSVTLSGTPAAVQRVKTKDLQAHVDVKDLPPGRYERDIVVKVPQDTTVLSTTPKQALIEIYNQKKLK